MNRVRIVKKDYQKLLKGLPQDHPPHILEHRYAQQEHDHSPDEPRTISYVASVYKEKSVGTSWAIDAGHKQQQSGKQLFKKHILQYDRLFGQDEHVERQLRHYRRNLDDTKRVKTLQRSIEYYNHTEERSDRLRKKDVRALSNPRRQSKLSPYVKKLNRQSLNVSRDRTKINFQSSSKVMRLPPEDSSRLHLKVGTVSEMKIVDRRSMRLRQDELLEHGKTAYQENKFAQAINLFSHLLAKNPKHLQGNYLMAVSLMGKNEFARAMRYFDIVIDTDPAYNRNVFILYAICCKKLLLSEQALNKLSSCIDLFPDYYDAYIYRGKLKLKEKKFSEAITDFIQANELNPDKSHGFVGLGDCFYSMKEDQKAYDMFSRALKIDPALAKSPISLKIVNCLSGMFRTEQALSLLNDYLKEHSNSSEGLLLKGNLLLSQKKYNEAIMAYDQLIKLNDRKYNTKALECMIRARICERDFYSAYHLIERIEFLDVDKDSLDRIRMFAEAVLFLMKRKFTESIDMFEEMARRFTYLSADAQTEPEDELEYFLKPLHHLYFAYGYFCLSDYQHARDKYIIYESILKRRNHSEKILQSSIYNRTLCEALLKYEEKLFEQAIEQMAEASAIYPNKVEPYVYQGIIHVQICISGRKEDEEGELAKALEMFSKGIEVMGEVSNNIIANVYYHKAVVNAYLSVWNEAMHDIDRAIEKSEDNIPKYFYLRGLILSCCQTFKQAVHDLSVCLSLNENFAEAFLMRSKCLQIEGEANEAFVDLQRYITLKPEDPFIHKYAGHLLFENGAFEDSILAYAHGEVIPERDIDIFLTRGKAYFLLGQFEKAHEDMQKVADHTNNEQNEIDLKTIKVLWEMKQVAMSVTEVSPNCYEHSVNQMTHILKENTCEGRIFKQKEFHMIRGGAFLYSGRYKEALLEFTQCMALREASGNKVYSDEEEEQDVDEAEEISAYLNHMRFNSALCYIMMGDFNRAKDMCNRCTIQKEKTTLQLLLCAIKFELGDAIEEDERQATIEVRELEIFSLKNKLSRYLSTINPKFKLNPQLIIRPCFSFPKVQPPEITPEFDRQILLSLDPTHIQNKPEAPWIRRADNSCIMFTSNIQVFDNLDLETEEKTKRNEEQLGRDYSAVDLDNECTLKANSVYKSQVDVSEMSHKDIEKVKQRLKLEGAIEKKLNKLIRKEHS